MEFNGPSQDAILTDPKVIGKSTRRIDGPLKTTGTAPYAYERHDVVPNQAYGYVLGAGIAKGRITAMNLEDARKAPGVIAIVAATEHEPVGSSDFNHAPLFGGRKIAHYHQAIACVVAETFEEARAAAAMIRTSYEPEDGTYDLAKVAPSAELEKGGWGDARSDRGDFEATFGAAAEKLDQHYTTPDESHAMMEPMATIAAWDGDRLTVWTSNQMINWGKESLASILSIPEDKIRVDSPYIGGGFGGKLFVRADAVMAALAAKAAKRPVKVMLQRPLIFNNTTHRPATIQRVRIGTDKQGRIQAIAHECWSGNITGQDGENATAQTNHMYAGDDRMTASYVTQLDLPEGNAMRAPGEAPGHMGLEVAIDEMAEKLGMDPIEFRILNEPKTMPAHPDRKFSERHLVRCLREGGERFGWSKRQAKPASVSDGRWLVGMGVSAGFRGAPTTKSAARVALDGNGGAKVTTDMTDIGTGSYTIIAQTAAECLGLPLEKVSVVLGDSAFPVSSGSGGQWGAASSTAGVYAACIELHRSIAQKLGIDPQTIRFEDGRVIGAGKTVPLSDLGQLAATGEIDFGDYKKGYDIGTYAGHFCEVGVDRYTGEIRIRRMLAVCDAGRILNPLSARSQVIGAMTMAAGATLMEELAVDKRFGYFVNHDLASYEVPVHADIPHQEVVFLDTPDPYSTPLQAKGVGELGICGPTAAIANAVYNATGIRVREYPITLDKMIDQLPQV
ncbi:molybdopterin-dependent oxidoreductase [Porphyrobacter algicida]|uniref:Molybdopterin-dependent oxidoreductase n=1 Tax=Qipengyuania algicida TaxID=1836209 RepID=A0A845AAK9_9SPHN|nr:aldehyde oxidoreductase molybdenum-binding subunit PaoC [Qipengyuania algicida]MXP27280.1 molybdopterin-dependent oxidoreductase [Qipengyuania algicida]